MTKTPLITQKKWNSKLRELRVVKERNLEMEKDMGAILQTCCDADEAPALDLLRQIADIANKHAFKRHYPPVKVVNC